MTRMVDDDMVSCRFQSYYLVNNSSIDVGCGSQLSFDTIPEQIIKIMLIRKHQSII